MTRKHIQWSTLIVHIDTFLIITINSSSQSLQNHCGGNALQWSEYKRSEPYLKLWLDGDKTQSRGQPCGFVGVWRTLGTVCNGKFPLNKKINYKLLWHLSLFCVSSIFTNCGKVYSSCDWLFIAVISTFSSQFRIYCGWRPEWLVGSAGTARWATDLILQRWPQR